MGPFIEVTVEKVLVFCFTIKVQINACSEEANSINKIIYSRLKDLCLKTSEKSLCIFMLLISEFPTVSIFLSEFKILIFNVYKR